MTRRDLGRLLAGVSALYPAFRAAAQSGPQDFGVYSDAPRLFLRPPRLKLLRRERERRSLRWDQFETLWSAGARFPEFGWTAALRYLFAQDESAGRQAVAWAVGPATDARQIALIADWCGPLISPDDKTLLYPKLERAASVALKPTSTLAEARNKTLAALALPDRLAPACEKALREVYEGFWMGTFIPGLRGAKIHVSHADANAMMELLHVFRDNLNFDLRESFGAWFKDYPLIHILAHYPEPFPASENEYRIPADSRIDQRGPDITKATLSRAAELAMVAFDSNSPETQLLQGFLMNDRFLMRGTLGIAYELLWANPYQPGLSYYHVPLVAHDAIGGQLFVRSSWEDNASWAGFFDGQLQLFGNGEVSRVDPRVAHAPMDLEEAVVFFAKEATKFVVPDRKPKESSDSDQTIDPVDDVFIIGLEPKRRYHIEADGDGMFEVSSDIGGIIYLPGLPAAAVVRFGPAPAL